MAVEGPRRRKFAQLMTHHVLRAVDRDELMAVMHRERQSDHVRYDHRTARPGADYPLVSGGDRRFDLLLQMAVDKGTFFLRPHRNLCLTLALRPPAHDIAVRRFLAARLVTLGRHSPRRLRMVALGSPLATAMRMVDRIHRHSAHMPALAQPAAAAGFADRNIFEFEITHLPDRRTAFRLHHALLARRQLEQGELAFLRHQLRLRPRATRQLRPRPRLQLDRMYNRADRNMFELQRVARFDIRLGAAFDLVANPQSLGRQDIALVAVRIMQQRDIRRSVGIVFQRRYYRRYAVAIALEIDHPQAPLMPAAAMARGHASEIIAPARMLYRRQQPLLRRLLAQHRKVRDLHETLPWSTRI